MALIIDSEKVEKLKLYAEANIITFNEFKRILRKEKKCVGDRKPYTVYFPTNFRLVYSIEYCCTTDMKTKIKCRRMSLSIINNEVTNNEEQRYPHIEVIKLIADMLGFSPLESGKVRVDIRKEDPIPNVDVIEILQETPMTDSDLIGLSNENKLKEGIRLY